ncbi:MAG: hypothetical protein NTW67_06220 [Candidatus Woesearchaeota archaeon]|nr:hypothetical protein [Candidatus Woesearchaeota archaeon]
MYSFRKASDSDKEVIYSIMEKNMSDYFNRFTPDGWSREKFDAGFMPERITVCEMERRIIGFYDVEARKDFLYLHNLQLTRGSPHLGSVFLERIEDEACKKGLSSIRAKMFVRNPAVRLALRQGFVVVGDILLESSCWMEKPVRYGSLVDD